MKTENHIRSDRIGGKAFIIVGMTGSGKSTLVKHLIQKVSTSQLWINDINGEYFPDRPYIPTDKFLQETLKLKRCVIVFEEATIFFSNRGNIKEMRELLVRKRWTESIIFMIFHSIRTIPHYIYDLCNGVYVFRTNDSRDLVVNKHEILLSAYDKVQNKIFKYGDDVFKFCEIVKLN